jgi:hypothetical protein
MSETSKKRVRANTEPDPETTPHVPDEQKKGTVIFPSGSLQRAGRERREAIRDADELRERDS